MHAQVSTYAIIGIYFVVNILFLLHLFINVYDFVEFWGAAGDESILQVHTQNSLVTYSIDPKYMTAIRYSFSLQIVYLYTNDMVSGLYYSYLHVEKILMHNFF